MSPKAIYGHLYPNFQAIRSMVHTHSRNAVTFAQAGIDLPCLGTTDCDYFHGPVPVPRAISCVVNISSENTSLPRMMDNFDRSRNLQTPIQSFASIPVALYVAGRHASDTSSKRRYHDALAASFASLAINSLLAERLRPRQRRCSTDTPSLIRLGSEHEIEGSSLSKDPMRELKGIPGFTIEAG